MSDETLLTAARRVVRFIDIDLNRGGLIVEETLIALDTLRKQIEKMANAEKHRGKYKHLKRGSVVQVEGFAELQAATGPVAEGALMIIYSHADDAVANKLYARSETEFHDGRFKRQDDA